MVTMPLHAEEEVWTCQITYLRTYSASSGLSSDTRPEGSAVTIHVNAEDKTCNGYRCDLRAHTIEWSAGPGHIQIDRESHVLTGDQVFGDGTRKSQFGGQCVPGAPSPVQQTD
jgi:hypothetical protein